MMHGKSPPPEHNNIHVTENDKYNKEKKSITMMRGKSPPEHNNIHFIENYKYNQLRVSLKEYLERNVTKKNNEGNFLQKRIFGLFL